LARAACQLPLLLELELLLELLLDPPLACEPHAPRAAAEEPKPERDTVMARFGALVTGVVVEAERDVELPTPLLDPVLLKPLLPTSSSRNERAYCPSRCRYTGDAYAYVGG
jgi:hypothetical protein